MPAGPCCPEHAALFAAAHLVAQAPVLAASTEVAVCRLRRALYELGHTVRRALLAVVAPPCRRCGLHADAPSRRQFAGLCFACGVLAAVTVARQMAAEGDGATVATRPTPTPAP